MSTKYIASNWRLPNEENSNKSDNYGLTFDGSEYIETPPLSFLNGKTNASWSVWIKPTDNASTRVIMHSQRDGATNKNSQFFFWMLKGNRLDFSISIESYYIRGDISYINYGQWNHVCVTFDGTGSTPYTGNMYINGVDRTTGTNLYSTLPTARADVNFRIGEIQEAGGYSFYDPFLGEISDFSIFDYTLSESQISTLYGSSSLGAGNPMALKPQPVAFYNLGDNTSGGLLPNPSPPPTNISILTQPNEAVEDASVFDFDDAPSNNFIDLGLINAIENSTSFTLSFWINPSSFTTPFTLLGNKTGFSGDSAKGIAFDVRSTFLIVYLSDDFTDYARVNNPLSLNEWTLLSVVYDGSGSTNADRLKIYYGDTQQTVNTFGGTIPSTSPTTGRSLILGKQATGQCIEAKISNFTIFSNALPETGTESIETLYNNGVPLNSITSENLKAWYKLDQSANWEADSSGAWQIPDAVSAYPQSFDFVSADGDRV